MMEYLATGCARSAREAPETRARMTLRERLNDDQFRNFTNHGQFDELICGRRYVFSPGGLLSIYEGKLYVGELNCFPRYDTPPTDMYLVNLLMARGDLYRLWRMACVNSAMAGRDKPGYMPYCRDDNCLKDHRERWRAICRCGRRVKVGSMWCCAACTGTGIAHWRHTTRCNGKA